MLIEHSFISLFRTEHIIPNRWSNYKLFLHKLPDKSFVFFSFLPLTNIIIPERHNYQANERRVVSVAKIGYH